MPWDPTKFRKRPRGRNNPIVAKRHGLPTRVTDSRYDNSVIAADNDKKTRYRELIGRPDGGVIRGFLAGQDELWETIVRRGLRWAQYGPKIKPKIDAGWKLSPDEEQIRQAWVWVCESLVQNTGLLAWMVKEDKEAAAGGSQAQEMRYDVWKGDKGKEKLLKYIEHKVANKKDGLAKQFWKLADNVVKTKDKAEQKTAYQALLDLQADFYRLAGYIPASAADDEERRLEEEIALSLVEWDQKDTICAQIELELSRSHSTRKGGHADVSEGAIWADADKRKREIEKRVPIAEKELRKVRKRRFAMANSHLGTDEDTDGGNTAEQTIPAPSRETGDNDPSADHSDDDEDGNVFTRFLKSIGDASTATSTEQSELASAITDLFAAGANLAQKGFQRVFGFMGEDWLLETDGKRATLSKKNRNRKGKGKGKGKGKPRPRRRQRRPDRGQETEEDQGATEGEEEEVPKKVKRGKKGDGASKSTQGGDGDDDDDDQRSGTGTKSGRTGSETSDDDGDDSDDRSDNGSNDDSSDDSGPVVEVEAPITARTKEINTTNPTPHQILQSRYPAAFKTLHEEIHKLKDVDEPVRFNGENWVKVRSGTKGGKGKVAGKDFFDESVHRQFDALAWDMLRKAEQEEMRKKQEAAMKRQQAEAGSTTSGGTAGTERTQGGSSEADSGSAPPSPSQASTGTASTDGTGSTGTQSTGATSSQASSA